MNNGLLISGTLFLLGAGSALAAEGSRNAKNDKYPGKETTLDLFGSASIGQQTVFTDETKNYGLGRAGLRFGF